MMSSPPTRNSRSRSGLGLPKLGRREGGFTLIELIAVILIIGLIMAIGAARMDYLIPKYRFRGAAREIGVAMKQGRARAVATGRDVFFEVDLGKGRYWLLAAFPRLDEDEKADLWRPLNEKHAEEIDPDDPLAGMDAPEDDRSRGYIYEPVFVRSFPGEPGDIQVVDVLFGQEGRVERGIARVRLSPFGASEHTIVNLRDGNGRELAVRMNGFTGHLTFHEGYKEAETLVEDDGR